MSKAITEVRPKGLAYLPIRPDPVPVRGLVLIFWLYILLEAGETLILASLTASSSEGSRTSQVAKLCRQKCRHGIPADFKSSSNVSFLTPANLLVLRSMMMNDRVFGSTFATDSGIGSILFPRKYDSVLIIWCRPFFLLPRRLELLAVFVLVESSWPGVMLCLFSVKPVAMAILLLMSRVQLPALRESFQFVVEEFGLCRVDIFLYSCRTTRREKRWIDEGSCCCYEK